MTGWKSLWIQASTSLWNNLKVWNGPCLRDCHDQIVIKEGASRERRAISRSLKNKWQMQHVVLLGLRARLVALYALSTWRKRPNLVPRPQQTLHLSDRHRTDRLLTNSTSWLHQSLSIWTYLWAIATSWFETTMEIQIQTSSRVYAALIWNRSLTKVL